MAEANDNPEDPMDHHDRHADNNDDAEADDDDDDDNDNDTFEDAADDHNSSISPPPLNNGPSMTRSLTTQRCPTTSPDLCPPDVEGTTAQSQRQMIDTSVEDHHTPPLSKLSKLSLDDDLDNVNLEGETDNNTIIDESSSSTNNQSLSPQQPLLPPAKSPATALQGFSGALPSVPCSLPLPPPPPPKHFSAPPPLSLPPPSRKLTSPFSWFPRNNHAAKEAAMSQALPGAGHYHGSRRDTASSIATIASNPELMLSKLEESQQADGGRKMGRNSLRDRFKLLRMRDEAGISLAEDEKGESILVAGKPNVVSPTSERGPEGQALASPLPTIPTSPNPSLAPGTAAGVSSPVQDSSIPVDWDLWQSVVYEGPAAVARSSPEELNRAIATGIPSAIRGVVWQVLAQSQNPELETVYRELVFRGTDKAKERMSGTDTSSSATTNDSANGNGKEKDSVTSSASSIHSDHSTPATTVNGMRSPTPQSEKEAETTSKQQAAATSERKKKTKEDAAALQKLEKAIKRDLGSRTSYSKFAASAGLQEGLFGVCKAYALYDEGVGYAQGMNFLAMPLLFNMPEEEAFCLLVRLMNQYRLRDLFIHDMPGLHMHLYLFERLLEDFEPALYCHLHRRQVSPHLYATQWFLTLFVYRFPLQLVLRIYDLIFSEGLAAILKFGIVLMQKNAATLLGLNDMVSLTAFLKDKLFDVYIDQSPSAGSILESGFFGSSGASIDKEVYRADVLVQDACAVKITPELLKAYTAEWEEKTRLEREREAELEGLRHANGHLAQRVRQLEARVQEHDAEHAALATDLIRTKVANEELQDRNEGLHTQVHELKQIVARQPEELEERLAEQMAATARRNEEVHRANARLEDELALMEKDLVETKMKYAEINANHETMARKFTDLRKALD